MKLTLSPALTACAALSVLAASASAQTYTGAGGVFPDIGAGAVYNNVTPSTNIASFTSAIAVGVPVASVDQVTITGWTHTWLGDMQVLLVDPSGVGHNLMVRLGHSAASTFGNSGDPTGTPHNFQIAGLPVPDTTVTTNMPAGTYAEHYGNPAKLWTAGNTINGMVVNNGLAGAAPQGPGVWTLTVFDWAGGDTGACTGWALQVNGMPPPAPTTYCTAKMNSVSCVPAIGAAGTSSAAGVGTFVISAPNSINNKPGLLIYATTQAAMAFSGGFLCVGPTAIKRSIPLSSGGNAPPNDCSGMYSIDMNLFAIGGLGGLPAAYLTVQGTVVNSQFWGRDPGFPAPDNAQLTGGLQFTVGP